MSNYWKKKLDELNKQNAKTPSNSSTSNNYWDRKMKELEESQKKQDEDIAPVKTTTNTLSAPVRFDTLESDMKVSSAILTGVYGGWTDADTMASQKSTVSSVYDRLLAYQEQYGTNGADVTESIGAYKSALDNWDALAEQYGNYKNADEYNKAIADYEGKVNLNQKEAQTEISELEAILSKANQYYAKIKSAKNKNNVWNGRAGMNAPGGSGNTAKYEKQLNEYLKENGYSSINELETAIGNKKIFLNQAKQIQSVIEFESVADPNSENYDPEFEKIAQKGLDFENPNSTKAEFTLHFGKGTKDTNGKLNKATYARDNSGVVISGSPWIKTAHTQMNEDEIKVYSYYFAKGEYEKADAYLKSIEETGNARYGKKMASTIEGNTALEITFGLGAGVEQFGTGVKNAFNFNDDYIPATATQVASQMIREDLEDVGVKLPEALGGASLGQVAYDSLNTFGNMSPSILVGMLNPAAGTAALGVSAAGNAYQEKLNAGWEKENARTYGTIVGASEALMSAVFSKAFKGVVPKSLETAIAGIDNGIAKFSAQYGLAMGSEALEEGAQVVLNPLFENIALGYNQNSLADVDWSEAAYSALLGGLSGGVFEAVNSAADSNSLTKNEKLVVDKEVQNRIAEAEKDGKKLTLTEKGELRQKVTEELARGEIATDTIESVLGGESYKTYKDTTDSEAKQESELKAEIETLENLPDNQISVKQRERLNAARMELADLYGKSQKETLKTKLSEDVLNLAKQDGEKLKGLNRGSYLVESYNEKARRNQAFSADLNKYKSPAAKQTVQNAIEYGKKGLIYDARDAHDFVDLAARISEDKGYVFEFITSKGLQKQIEEGNPYEIDADPNKIDAFVSEKHQRIFVNLDAKKSLNSLVGHEITDTLRKANSFDALKTVAIEVAKAKGEYDSRLESTQRRYKNIKSADIEGEMVSDIVGDYLFTDYDFIRNLSTNNRNVFQQIWDEVKYLYKMATAGSKEARQLETLKHNFEKAYKESANAKTAKNSGVNLSLSGIDNAQELVYNGKRGEEYVRTDEFRSLQAESKRMSAEEWNYYIRGGENETVRRRVSTILKRQMDSFRSSGGSHNGVLKLNGKGNQFNIYEGVSPSLFHDIFEVTRKYLKNGELVDLHDVKTTEEHGVGYAECYNYLSEDGLSGFSITPDGDLISVFNASEKGGFLRAISDIVKTKAKTLDCYASPSQNLMEMYQKTFGFKTASVMDYNMEYDHDNIAENHDYPKVAFMVNTEADVETKAFTEEQYDEAVAYRNSFVNQATYNKVASFMPKNADAEADVKTKYSLSEDSKGREIGDAVKKRFEKSKVVDENGRLKAVYHGTYQGEFTIFDKAKGSVEGDFGSGFYFTDNEYDVSEHYEGGGPDFENKVGRRADEIWNENPDLSYEEAEERAHKELYQGSHKFEVYLNIENPAIVGETNLFEQEKYFSEYNQDDYDNEDDFYADVEQLVADDIDNVIWEIERNVDVNSTDGISEILWEAFNEGGVGIEELKKRVNNLYLEDSEGNAVANEVVRQIIESLGYDGIIDPTVSGKWNMEMEEGTTHYIAFKPNQIKSVTNENPTDNPDIHRSIAEEGTQKEYGNFNVYGEDIRYRDIAPTKEDIAPTQKVDISLYEERSDPSVAELEAKKAELEPKIMESLQADDMETFERLSYEHQELTERIKQYEEADAAFQNERISTLDDSLAPIEQEIEQGEEVRDTTPITKTKSNEIYKSVKAILGFSGRDAQAAKDLIAEYTTDGTIDRDKLFELIRDKFGRQTETVEDEYIKSAKDFLRNNKIKVSPEIKADIADYNDLRKHLFNKIGFAPNGIGVDEAYKEIAREYPGVFEDEENIKNPTDQFLALVKVANDTSVETVERMVDDETLLEATNAIINGVNQYRQEQRQRFYEQEAKKIPFPEEAYSADDIAPVAEAFEAIRPKQNKEPKLARATSEEQARAEILTEEPETEKKNNRFWSQFMEKFADKGFVFENLSKKTKNRELEAKWNFIRYAEGNAQTFMREGEGGVKSLKSIVDRVEKSGKTKEFYEYLYHQHNVDRMTLAERNLGENKAVFGNTTTAEVSRNTVAQLEKANPEFKAIANEVYTYNKHLRQMLVDGGVISQETADLWEAMYPHYVPIRRLGDSGLNINVPLDSGKTGVNAPIKRATGGSRDILPLFDTMAQRTLQTYKAIAKNRFGVELKNTLNSTIAREATNLDGVIESIDSQDGLLQEGKNGRKPTFTVFENGEKVTFEITEDMYDALKPKSEQLAYTNKFLNTFSNLQRNILTQYNPVFMLTNAAKDIQDVLVNSQHAAKTYSNVPNAVKEIVTKGKWYTEYMRNGGEQNTYFENESNTFKEDRSGIKKLVGMPLDVISTANDFIEKIPRLAEYIASRKSGRSVEVSMLDAARVTTNFAAGGDVTKFFNRNGATFLNASVQGAMQQVRNVREAKMNGVKGWAVLATKFAFAGLAAEALNHLLWDDDEEYEELSDYVKQNYYVVAKMENGTFIRIPKGRTVAVIQDAYEQISNAATGDDEVDLKSFLDLLLTNLAPNSIIDDNVFAPIKQAKNNKTWYGEDLVPTRLQDLPAAEQYDESTDALSKWLGEKTGLSPYKINYVLDQYSGGVGDVFLPMMTSEAESGDNSLVGKMLAPLKDKFTTDSTMKNQNVSDFYDMMDELTANAKSSKATDEDILKSKFINAVNSELSDLYKQRREIQNSTLSDAEKYSAVRDIQKQINAITKESLNDYKGVSIDNGYATVGDLHYRVNKDGEWTKITDKQLEKQEDVTRGLGISASEYWSNKDEYDFAYDYPDKYRFFNANGITYEDYANADEDGKRAYTWAAENPKKYEIAKAVSDDVIEYRKYTSDLYDLKADKDSNGKTISGSAKEKKVEYINGLDLDYGQKIILFKSLYEADDTYNYEIVEYLNGRDDITRSEMITILKELGFTVSSDGTVSW